MSIFGEDAARRLRELDPEAARAMAAELRNAVSPAASVVGLDLFNATNTGWIGESIDDTVRHLKRLADVLDGGLA